MDLRIEGDIDGIMVYYVADSLKNEYKNGEQINVIMNSLGGFIDDAVYIADMLISAKEAGSKIVCTNTGDVASAATIIWLLGDERKFDMSKGEYLIHQPYVVEAEGTAEDLIEMAVELSRTQDQLATMYSTYSGKPIDEILERMEQDEPMTWKELFEYKMATEVETDEI